MRRGGGDEDTSFREGGECFQASTAEDLSLDGGKRSSRPGPHNQQSIAPLSRLTPLGRVLDELVRRRLPWATKNDVRQKVGSARQSGVALSGSDGARCAPSAVHRADRPAQGDVHEI